MKVLGKSLLTVLLCMTVTWAWAQNEKKELRKADQHLGYNEFKEAIPYLERAKDYNPANAMTQFLLGKCYYETNVKTKAKGYFDKAYELNPRVHPEIYYYYAKTLHYALDFDKAKDMYAKALTQLSEKDPKYSEIKLAIGHCDYGKRAVQKPNGAKIVNFGPTINTVHAEHSPIISADESVLIYTTVRPDNIGCKGDPRCPFEDIYITHQTDGKWSKPEPIGNNINTKDYDASIGLSPDGQRLFIYKNPPGNGDIFYCDLEGEEWSKPKTMGAPINTKAYETTVSVSPDGKHIYFTSDREGGYGDLDIYTSSLNEDGSWSEPKNLGKEINTPHADDSPFIHPNGKTLYFSSMGRPDCIGGYDIYKTELQEDGSWSRPENVGYPINTPDNDIYFVMSADFKHGYYASAKEGGYGDKDIYKIDMPDDEPVVVEEEEKDTANIVKVIPKNPLTILKGTVTDALSGDPLESLIQVYDNEKKYVIAEFRSNSKTGKYLVSLPSGKNYGIRVEKEDYLFHSENFNIPEATDFQEIEKDVELKKISIGESIILKNIFFDYNKATLRPESESELERLYKYMTDIPTMKIEISGHTDSDGSETYNQKLSENRAKAVVDYLINRGIDRERMVAVGQGELMPIATNDTPEGKQQNRRTELKILEK